MDAQALRKMEMEMGRWEDLVPVLEDLGISYPRIVAKLVFYFEENAWHPIESSEWPAMANIINSEIDRHLNEAVPDQDRLTWLSQQLLEFSRGAVFFRVEFRPGFSLEANQHQSLYRKEASKVRATDLISAEIKYDLDPAEKNIH